MKTKKKKIFIQILDYDFYFYKIFNEYGSNKNVTCRVMGLTDQIPHLIQKIVSKENDSENDLNFSFG